MNPWGLGVICARVRGAGGISQGGQQALWGCVAQHTWKEEQVKQELWKLILCWHKVLYSHELSLKMEFVCFRLPVPSSEEAHHPFHPRPPPFPRLSLFSLLKLVQKSPSVLWQCLSFWHLALLVWEGVDLKERTQAKVFCSVQTRKVRLESFATEYKISGYLGRKCVLDAKFLQSRSKFEKWVDVEDRDGQVKWLRDERPGK